MFTKNQLAILHVIAKDGTCERIKNKGNFSWNKANCHDCVFFRKQCGEDDLQDLQELALNTLKLDKLRTILR